MTSGSSISSLRIKKGPVGLILYRRWGSRWVEPASWILKFSLQDFNLAPTQYRQLCRLFKIVILILVCVKIIIQAATPPQFLPSSTWRQCSTSCPGDESASMLLFSKVVKERSCKEEGCRHFDCSHGLSSVCSPRLSHHSACIWFFNDSIWYCKHYRCTSLVFLRWFWNMGRHLGKESKLYSLSWRNLMRNFCSSNVTKIQGIFRSLRVVWCISQKTEDGIQNGCLFTGYWFLLSELSCWLYIVT